MKLLFSLAIIPLMAGNNLQAFSEK